MSEKSSPNKSVIEEFMKVAFLAKPLLPSKIYARDAILQMKNGGSNNWKQMEWIGFWFEYFVESEMKPSLGNTSGPTYGNTTFDLQIDHVWDLKAHPSHLKYLLLNDQEAVNLCINERGGVGFIVIDGFVEYDDVNQTFKKWHDDLKGELSNYVKARIARKAPTRRRKISFEPNSIIGIWLHSIDDLIKGQEDGWISGFQKNMKNSNGNLRRSKFKFDTSKIPKANLVGEIKIL